MARHFSLVSIEFLIVVTLCLSRFPSNVLMATIEEIGWQLDGPLWKQTGISLISSGLSGPIPPELGNLTNLTYLDLSQNSLAGPIPPELGNLTNLTYLDLSQNSLAGPIPPELGNLTNLTQLILSHNGLSGPIPLERGNLTKLTYIDLSHNKLSGPIPPQLGNLRNLENVYLQNNKLSGLVPSQLIRRPGDINPFLINLDLSSNYLSGPLPASISIYPYSLNLSNNGFSGSIPRLLLSYYLDLSNNKFTGTIPQLDTRNYLDLSNNSLTGPIPSTLGNFGLHRFFSSDNDTLKLCHNNLTGPIPPSLSNWTALATLDLSSNSISGPIPLQLGKLSNLLTLNLSFTDTTCSGLDLSQVSKLSKLGLPCSLPASLRYTNLTYVTLSIGTPANELLDLSSLPDSCKIVNITGWHPKVHNIQFWKGCNEGCILNLAGTGSRISRSTRRKVCLSKISVFFSGDIPYPLYYDPLGLNFSNVLKNQQGTYNLTDPNFLDKIDLGPDGIAFTGVGFSRVQANNMCSNPEARTVAAFVFGAAAVLLLLTTFFIIVVGRWRRHIRGQSESKRRCHNLRQGGVYLWGAALGVLPVVDLVTDVLVLCEVWRAWPMWVLLVSICAPFTLGAYMLAIAWMSSGGPVRSWKGMRVRLLWPLPEVGEHRCSPLQTRGRYSWLLVIVLLPLGLVGVLVQDLLFVVERFGLHLAWGDEIAVFERYHESRVMAEVLLESLPQAIFQTGLYIIGSSRATRIYIDQRIFVQSVVVSLCSLLMHYCTMLWEAVYEGRSLVRVFLDRFRSTGQPSLVTVSAAASEDEEVEGLSHKVAS